MKEEESYDLKRSREAIEALYPVLEDVHGQVIDGMHRLDADPGWPRRRLESVKTRKQFLVARIVANSQRRRIPREERRKEFDLLATELMDGGSKPGEIASEIERLTGFTRKYVLELVRDEFKRGYERKSAQPTFEPRETEPSIEPVAAPAEPLPARPEEAPTPRAEAAQPALPEEAPTPPAEAAPPRPGLSKPTDHVDRLDEARNYIAEYRIRYAQPDVGFLAWDVCRRFGLETGEAKRLIQESPAPRELPVEPRATPEAARRRPAARPEVPRTTRCPLCGRASADLTLILARMEEFESQTQPLAEWLKEARGR